jgi:hypothetical protein
VHKKPLNEPSLTSCGRSARNNNKLGAVLEAELRAVRGKHKAKDLVFGEMGHLAVRPTIEGLKPEIIDASFANQVGDGFAIFLEMYGPPQLQLTWEQRAKAGVGAKHFQEALKAKS